MTTTSYAKPHAFGGKPPSIAWIQGQYQHLKTIYDQRNREYAVLRDAFDGNFNSGDADRLDLEKLRRDRTKLVYNMVYSTTRRFMDGMSSPPRVDGVPRGFEDKETELADKTAKLIDCIWDENKMNIKLIQAGYCQSLLDRAIFSVRPAPYMKYKVRIDLAVPDFYFPITKGDNWEEPLAVIYGFRCEDENSLDRNPMKFEDTAYFNTVIEYWDPQWFIRITKDGVTAINHKLGIIPWHTAHNLPIPHRYRGVGDSDQAVHLNEYLNMLMSAMGDMIAYAAAPIAIVRGTKMGGTNLPFEPRAVWELERDAQVGFLQWSGTPPAVEAQILRTIQANEDVTGVTGPVQGRDIPAGTSDKAIRSLTAGFSNRLGTKQTCMADALADVNSSALLMLEHYYPNEKFEIIGEDSRPGKEMGKPRKYYIQPKELGGWYKTKLVFPPQDPSAAYFQEIDKYEKELQSKYTTQKNIGIRNPWDEQQRIRMEKAEKVAHENDLGLAKTGQWVNPETRAADQQDANALIQGLKDNADLIAGRKREEQLNRDLNRQPPVSAPIVEPAGPAGPAAEEQEPFTIDDVLSRLRDSQAQVWRQVNGRVLLGGAIARDGSATSGEIQVENPADENIIRQALGNIGIRFTFKPLNNPGAPTPPGAIDIFGERKK